MTFRMVPVDCTHVIVLGLGLECTLCMWCEQPGSLAVVPHSLYVQRQHATLNTQSVATHIIYQAFPSTPPALCFYSSLSHLLCLSLLFATTSHLFITSFTFRYPPFFIWAPARLGPG